MPVPRDIADQRFTPISFGPAPFQTVSVYYIKDTSEPNRITRITGRLVTLVDGTQYVCGPTSIVRIGPRLSI